jgi:eukaryotic-like serine/threonine-protein kinase
MKKQRWEKVESILDTALTLAGETRKTYILEACSNDDDLLREIYELLDAIEKSEQSDFLATKTGREKMLMDDLSEISVSDEEELIGKEIGAFIITDQIGYGGMGAVFKAERAKGDFSQQVAIKILQNGLKARDSVHRFRMEQQILASLHHPNIAALYDGGVTANGLPFLVMEYVDGMPVDEYCDKHKLSLRERLILFKDICSAVQYAHSNLIIHRDLKADNIFVDSDGNVKVLDFGIAKLLDPQLSEAELLETRPGQKFWTPAYAAPEQVAGKQITTATDVYSLGVLLNKLLSGLYPFDLRDKPMSEIEQMVINTEPDPPSKIVKSSEITAQLAGMRRLNPSQLVQELTGDLDAIVLKALRKEQDRRYVSIDPLLDDINRYLDGFPVQARPYTVTYKAEKFVKRNKALVFGSAAVFLSIITATILSVSFAIETKQAEERALAQAAEAERQTEIANSVNLFLQQIIGQADPVTNPTGSDLTLLEAVELANNLVEESFSDQPEVETAVRYTLGVVDMNLGRLDRSIDQLNQALELSIATFGEAHRQTLGVRSQLGLVYVRNGSLEEAENVLMAGYEAALNAPREDWKESSMVLNQLGLVYLYRQDGASAEPYLRASYDQKMEMSAEETSNKLTTLHNISGALMMQGKIEEATEIAQEVLERRIELRNGFHPEVAQSMNAVAYMLMQQDRFEEALPIRLQDLEMRQDLYDGDHPDLARAMHNLANLYHILGRYDEALPVQENAVAMWKRTLPETHIDIQRGLVILSRIHTSMENHTEALAVREEHLNLLTASGNGSGSQRYPYLIEMVPNYLGLGDLKGAERLVEEAMGYYDTDEGRSQWQYHSAKNLLGELLFKQGVLDQSELYLAESAEAILDMKDSLDPALVQSVVQRTNNVYESLGKPVLALD